MNVPEFEPTFNTLGLFDEESCRFFLRELGERIVPFYPYFVGIEEVYSVLLERFGRAQIADVLSVLHELLEDDAAAGGFGDDGDIWRSWRYSWRHRNDGLSTPPVARVGNFVLPPPTPLFIRRFKAENFAMLYTNYSVDTSPGVNRCAGFEGKDTSEHRQPPSIFGHQVSSDVSEATAALQTLADPPLGHQKSRSNFQHSPIPTSNSRKELVNLQKDNCEQDENDIDSEQDFLEIGFPTSLGDFDPSLCLSFDMIQSRADNAERRLSLRGGDLAVCKLQQISNISLDNEERSSVPSGKDLAPKTCKGHDKTSQPAPTDQNDFDKPTSTAVLRASRDEQLSPDSPGCGESFKIHINPDMEQSQSVKSSSDMAAPQRSTNRQARLIDGAIFTGRDRKAKNPHSSPLKCEKYHQNPISVYTRSPSFAHSQGTTYRPSTDSTLCSELSQISSQREVRNATRDLRKTEIMSHEPDLSPVDEADVFRAQPSPMSFSSVVDANPFRGEPIPLTPSAPAPLSFRKASDPDMGFEAVHIPPVPKLPQSRSEPNMQPYTPRTPKRVPIADYHISPHPTPFPSKSYSHQVKKDVDSPSRGRPLQKSETPAKCLQKFNKDKVLDVKDTPKKRSRSPVKRFFKFGKSSSLKDIAGEPQIGVKESRSGQVKQGTGTSWSNKLRHGFLTSDTDEGEDKERSVIQSPPQQSTFPISLEPPFQARLVCELELMLVVCANRFLLKESEAGRISAMSVVKLREAWASINRPQVIEFQYDLLTQRDLVLANLKAVQLKGECAENPIVLNAAMYGWKTMAKEMNIRTFCAPDSVIRKWLHDSHKIFEMLGAPVQTFFAFQDLQLQALSQINEKQKMKSDRKHLRNASSESEKDDLMRASESGLKNMTRSPMPGSYPKGRMRIATGAEGVIEGGPVQFSSIKNRDAFENSRGGRLGLKVREFGK